MNWRFWSAGVVAVLFVALMAASESRVAGHSDGTNAGRDESARELPARAAVVPRHPLDPLTEAELSAAVDVLKSEGRLTERSRFPVITLHEPAKADVVKHQPGDAVARRAFVSVFDPSANTLHESVVDLAARKSVSWKRIDGAQPPVLVEEYEAAARIVREDPRWQEAMRRRGIRDLAKVQLDSWAGGSLVIPGHEGARLLRVLSYWRGDGNNGYARPIEGVVATVNMTTRRVAEFVDRSSVPISDDAADIFDPAALGPPRDGLKPLTVRQEAGPSFIVEGNEVRWQNWRFRFVLHPREGLVLHTVGYEDGGKLRPIAYRASLSEMLVPYGDSDAAWNWRSAFDQGEYGLGQYANSLKRGEEVPENAALFSAMHADEAGQPLLRKDIVALYEQDAGILWRHLDYESLRTVSRRGRQLVIHYVFTVGNYDYGLKWIFHQDGTLEAQVELTGILLAKGVADLECAACRQRPDGAGRIVSEGADRHGTLVAKNIVAPNHQHYFCFRLDLDVDGPANSAAELDLVLEEAARNPQGNAFHLRQQLLRTEDEGRRAASPQTMRSWKVFNAGSKNDLGHLASYVLEPGPMPRSFLTDDSPLKRRGGFVEHPFWVTRYEAGEMYAAGAYPSQNLAGDGLPHWSQPGESLDNTDLVVWHALGVTHVPRPEEWPVMSTARAGFKLAPHGFFRRNPALDVPALK